MLFTLILEFVFAIYVFVTGKLRPATILIIALLICLGIFQLAEYQVCAGAHTVAWVRIGYAAITLLPALGLHLVSLAIKRTWARNIGYALATAFILIFLISTQSVQGAVCGGNYVLINTSGVVATTYFPYYYIIALSISISEILSFTTTKVTNHPKDREVRSMLYWLLGGIGTFIIPTAAVYILSPSARSGIPSIMCGFAVFFAITLTVFVYPLSKKLDL